MASFNTPNIQLGEQGYFYEVNGYKYTGTFPYEWAINHLPSPVCKEYGSGPKDCANCRDKGTINDVFVGYCFNCLDEIYNGEHAEKRNGVYYAENATDEELWEACPYMQGIYRAQIGDKKYEYGCDNVSSEDLELSDEDEEQQEKVYRKPEYVSNEIANINFMEFMASLRPQNSDEDNEDDENYLAKQQEENDLRRQQDQEDEDYYYEQYRENDSYADYYDCDYDEPYSCEYPITRRELASIPADMRAVFDPEYQSALANFRAAARGI